MRYATVLLVLAAGACADDQAPYQRFDARQQSLRYATELQLIDAMGRVPERVHPLDDRTKILQWSSSTKVTTPGIPPSYQKLNGVWTPIGGVAPETTEETCTVEWLVIEGQAAKYRWKGHACRG